MCHRQEPIALLTPRDVVKAARQYIGVPYKKQGRTRRGLDCVGLLKLVAIELGENPRDERGYGANISGKKSEIIVSEHCDLIPKEKRQAGDLVQLLMGLDDPQHWGILTDTGMIHAYSKEPRCVTEHSLNEEWIGKIRKVYRLRGIAQL